jgi:3-deoxy-D-glycero-D-galacto-nononate 9-phosphate synthase
MTNETKNPETYIIAEAGQNHNGSMEYAKKLIEMSAMPVIDNAYKRIVKGVNAIKFTKRDLSEELTKDAWNEEYNSPNAFGRTYGEHREALELSYDQHVQIGRHAFENGLDFIETLTSPKTVKLLEKVKVKYIKIASRDLTNIPLLVEVAKSKVPLILSTGMGGEKEINIALNEILSYHDNIILLHCISQYPADYTNLNLSSIQYMKEKYPFKIGYSDHSIGIMAPVAAVAMGAEYIEKHITLNHSMKGSDQAGSLEPNGLWRMVRDIRNYELSVGTKGKAIHDSVEQSRIKLERSICTKNEISKNQLINEDNLIMLSPGGGLAWTELSKIVGKRAKNDIRKHAQLKLDDING